MTVELLSKIGSAHVAVIGDVMLDVYLRGVIDRISPEAPVPVVRALGQHFVPGGAANVAANILALGAKVQIVGVIGTDGADLLAALQQRGLPTANGLIVAPGRQTTRKQRILAGQQVVRVDFEDTHPLDEAVQGALIARALVAVEEADTIILSDYGKGTLTPAVIEAVNARARELAKIVIVDPKRRDLSFYRGATILTPNRAELTAATGLACESDEQAGVAIERAQEAFGGAILFTRSEKGLSWYPVEGEPVHYPTHAREVFDVSGAGDTIVATLATMLACGAEIADAIHIANHAAGIVVGKVGTATAALQELREAIELADGHLPGDGELVTDAAAAHLCRQWQGKGLTVGLTNGCFDLIHPGHISLIRQASAVCDRLIVLLNTDASVKRLKGSSRPAQHERARAKVIGAIKGVDLVVLFDEDTPLEMITALKPDVLIKGADYSVDTVVGSDLVIARGGKVVLADLVPGQSTTRLITAER